jgi:hypothetical protein
MGTDIAIVDNAGTVHIFTTYGVLDRMYPNPGSPAGVANGIGDTDTVVGLHWLPVNPAELKVRV